MFVQIFQVDLIEEENSGILLLAFQLDIMLVIE